jgi:glycosyltransferase domain-containing protein
MCNHSVYIFTYNRSTLLKRQLNVFSILKIESKVYILDGSTNLIEKTKNQEIAKKYNVNYYYEVSYQKRFKLIDELNTTDFISYCSDDDIVDPRFYSIGSDFLKKNNSYSAVTGRYLCLQYNPKYKFLGYRLINHLPNDFDINTEDFITNIVHLEAAYRLGCPPTHYGVRSFESHKILSNNVARIKYFTSVEQLEKISILLSGGVKVLPYFFGLRDYYNTPTTHKYRDLISNDNSDILILKDVIKKNLLNQNKGEYFSELATQYAYSINFKTTTRKNYLSFTENKSKAIFDVIKQYIFNNLENLYESGLDLKFKKAFRKVFFN